MTKDGQSLRPYLAGRIAPLVRRSFSHKQAPVNLIMSLVQRSGLCSWIRLLLAHRYCSSCLPEVEGGKLLLVAEEALV